MELRDFSLLTSPLESRLDGHKTIDTMIALLIPALLSPLDWLHIAGEDNPGETFENFCNQKPIRIGLSYSSCIGFRIG